MFRAVPQGQYISSKSQSVKPDVVSDVSPLDQIRILLPSFLGFIDPRQTFLRMIVSVSGGRGQIVPDPDSGVHSLFRNVIVRDGSNTATIESLEDYNSMVGATKAFTEQSSIAHKRALFEGVQPSKRETNTLYYGVQPSLTGSTSVAPVRTERAKNQAEVYIKLQSGLLDGSQIIPVSVLDGLRLYLDTEDPQRALYMLDEGQGIGQFNDAGTFIIPGVAIEPSADIPLDAFDVTGATKLFTMLTSLDCNDEQKENPWVIGDILHIELKAGGAYNEVVGVITGFYTDGGKLGIEFRPQRETGGQGAFTAVDSQLFVKAGDRVAEQTGIWLASDTTSASGVLAAPSYKLAGIEMRCLAVQPPASYASGIMSKAQSSGGVSMDILTSELHRHNQVASSGVTQDPIPTLAKRAKSILVQPIPNDNYRQITKHSFRGVADGARDYQLQLGTELIPSRKASLLRYSQTPARPEPLHMTELQKALINIGKPVMSLQKIEDKFLIARAFNRYGQTTDLSEETLSLRVDYDAGAKQKVFNNFVYKLARVTIAKGSVSVES